VLRTQITKYQSYGRPIQTCLRMSSDERGLSYTVRTALNALRMTVNVWISSQRSLRTTPYAYPSLPQRPRFARQSLRPSRPIVTWISWHILSSNPTTRVVAPCPQTTSESASTFLMNYPHATMGHPMLPIRHIGSTPATLSSLSQVFNYHK
jgi:hypothetical protein